MTQLLVTTTENIPGHPYEVLGEVFGLTTQSKNLVRNIGASLKGLVGGEIKDYTKMLEESRDVAVNRLRDNASAMGADAVVMMRFDTGSISQDMQSVAAYGTAVRFINTDSTDTNA
ncbi:heavy metal-binding domain-containing protein [Lactiplantibacillus pentosus]|uniref:heavy metal-binding domain-containing protein n=1 Tax=Lactiplantibacillus pentosus TaxID=1589 RepID=UPI0022E8D5B6|nr:heavy metal-binding domain-containing protein [Lactiplantibacillus pentosus]